MRHHALRRFGPRPGAISRRDAQLARRTVCGSVCGRMIHHVFANKSNIGDWLSAQGIQRLLGVPVIEHLCDEPFVPETLEALRELKANDLIVIGGGGLFMDYFVPFWEGFREIASRVPFCIWGVGYCHIKREDSRPPPSLLE